MNVFKTSALLLGLTMALWIGSNPAVEVAASPLAGAVQAVPDSMSAIQQVQDRPRVRPDRPRVRPDRDYPRYSYRTPTYRYYYDGWWYATPWWFWFGPFSFGYDAPYYPDYSGNWDAHVRWCYNRYRSYDSRTDTFLGYDGYRHRCRSPYRP